VERSSALGTQSVIETLNHLKTKKQADARFSSSGSAVVEREALGMAASIGSPASDSDMLDTPHKANSANQPHESSFNGASRVVGLDGAADDRGT
jgi:hypothetical protein